MKFLLQYLFASAVLLAGCSGQGSSRTEMPGPSGGSHRIISFAPSITETLFALGKGGEIVGVTRFCNYPPQTRNIPRVGGYTDPNFEMILGLRPDIVFALNEHGPLKEFLTKNHIVFQVIKNESLNEIMASFRLIAARCGVAAEGDSLAEILDNELSHGDDALAGDSLSVLICAGRDAPGSGHICKLFAAGARTFYTDLLRAAGCRNACTDTHFVYPELSTEGIARMGPDIVIDVMPSVSTVSTERAVADWNSIPLVPAVRDRCIYCLTGDYATIPGPRIVLLFRDIKRIVADARGKKR